jgi:hypothetical protein
VDQHVVLRIEARMATDGNTIKEPAELTTKTRRSHKEQQREARKRRSHAKPQSRQEKTKLVFVFLGILCVFAALREIFFVCLCVIFVSLW